MYASGRAPGNAIDYCSKCWFSGFSCGFAYGMPPREFNIVQPDSPKSGSEFDIAVIGGGVMGIAVLRRFAMVGLRCVLFDMGAAIISVASKGNSVPLHTGFDAPPKILELACIQAGYAEYLAIRQKLNPPLLETSALLVAWGVAGMLRTAGRRVAEARILADNIAAQMK